MNHNCQAGAVLTNLIDWVDSRIEAEIAHRPDVNIHKHVMTTIWGEIRRKLETTLLDLPHTVPPPTDKREGVKG